MLVGWPQSDLCTSQLVRSSCCYSTATRGTCWFFRLARSKLLSQTYSNGQLLLIINSYWAAAAINQLTCGVADSYHMTQSSCYYSPADTQRLLILISGYWELLVRLNWKEQLLPLISWQAAAAYIYQLDVQLLLIIIWNSSCVPHQSTRSSWCYSSADGEPPRLKSVNKRQLLLLVRWGEVAAATRQLKWSSCCFIMKMLLPSTNWHE
jgi:hypothetical protein